MSSVDNIQSPGTVMSAFMIESPNADKGMSHA
jgi:hypothetical protein